MRSDILIKLAVALVVCLIVGSESGVHSSRNTAPDHVAADCSRLHNTIDKSCTGGIQVMPKTAKECADIKIKSPICIESHNGFTSCKGISIRIEFVPHRVIRQPTPAD